MLAATSICPSFVLAAITVATIRRLPRYLRHLRLPRQLVSLRFDNPLSLTLCPLTTSRSLHRSIAMDTFHSQAASSPATSNTLILNVDATEDDVYAAPVAEFLHSPHGGFFRLIEHHHLNALPRLIFHLIQLCPELINCVGLRFGRERKSCPRWIVYENEFVLSLSGATAHP
jgi:hypothetical protein